MRRKTGPSRKSNSDLPVCPSLKSPRPSTLPAFNNGTPPFPRISSKDLASKEEASKAQHHHGVNMLQLPVAFRPTDRLSEQPAHRLLGSAFSAKCRPPNPRTALFMRTKTVGFLGVSYAVISQ
jgi:hypothetical protein